MFTHPCRARYDVAAHEFVLGFEGTTPTGGTMYDPRVTTCCIAVTAIASIKSFLAPSCGS